jgi:hypothetical protein
MRVTKFSASFGTSAEIRGTWYKFNSGIEVEFTEGDDIQKGREKAWNTVIHEVEKQIMELNND